MRIRAYLLSAGILTLIVVPFIVFEALQSTVSAASRYPIDYYLFGPSGSALLTGHWGSVYQNPANQAGPFELMTYGIAHLLGLDTALGWTVFYTVVSALLAFGTIFVLCIVRGREPRSGPWYLAFAVCALVVVGSYIPSALFDGHPAEIAVPVLWLVAAILAKRGAFVACGVVIALSAGWEVWGVLGAPVILLAARPGFVRAGLGGLAGVILLFVPFIATGVFGMFSFNWPVTGASLFSVIAPHLSSFPWSLRLAQAVVALAAGCAVALLARSSRYAVWLVPLGILFFRLALDPVLARYYWFAAAIVAIGLLAHLLQRRQWIAAFLAALLVAALATPAANFVGAIVLAVLVVVVAIIVHVRRQPEPTPV